MQPGLGWGAGQREDCRRCRLDRRVRVPRNGRTGVGRREDPPRGCRHLQHNCERRMQGAAGCKQQRNIVEQLLFAGKSFWKRLLLFLRNLNRGDSPAGAAGPFHWHFTIRSAAVPVPLAVTAEVAARRMGAEVKPWRCLQWSRRPHGCSADERLSADCVAPCRNRNE
jgi:hypothetical protein